MIRGPPDFTRTDPLFPNTPRFRSSGYARARDEVAAASWANTVNGKLARRIDQASEQTIPAIAACPKDHGWKREKRDGAYWCFGANRSEEHTSELQSLMRISYAVFCLKKKITIRYNFVY